MVLTTKGLGAARTVGACGVLGLGLDLVHVPRFRSLLARYEHRFLRRAFHPTEVQEFRRLATEERRLQYVASRWAVKEAAFKALSAADVRVQFPDVRLAKDGRGRPSLELEGTARLASDALGADRALVSLSHDADYAVAEVLLLG
jgi:holo-[acyl-carrier protein] synthase